MFTWRERKVCVSNCIYSVFYSVEFLGTQLRQVCVWLIINSEIHFTPSSQGEKISQYEISAIQKLVFVVSQKILQY